MQCIFDSKMYAITLMLFLGKCGPCSKRYWVVQIETIQHPVTTLCAQSAFSTGDIIYLPIIIKRLNGLLQCRPTTCMLCTFFENDFFKKRKLKLKLSLALYERQNIIGSHWSTLAAKLLIKLEFEFGSCTHTDAHIDGDVIWPEWHEGLLCDQHYRLPVAVCLQNFWACDRAV